MNNDKRHHWFASWVLALGVIGSLGCEQQQRSPLENRASAARPAPESIALHAAHIAATQAAAGPEYHFSHPQRDDSALGRNRAHGLDIELSPKGARVTARSGESTEFRWVGIGRGERLRPVPLASSVELKRNHRRTRHAGALEEWFVNGPLGLEHGFVIRERVAGDSRLVIELSASGDLTPTIDARGEIALRSAAGRTVLRYTDLFAQDAHGKALPGQMSVAAGAIRLLIDDTGASYPLQIDPLIWAEQQKLGPVGSVNPNEYFGWAVAVDGTTAVIGGPGDANWTGGAYVFSKNGGSWTLQQQLLASDAELSDQFGVSVAVQADTIVVGASWDDDSGTNAGAAYVFVRSGNVWIEQQKLLASDGADNDGFGSAVAVEGDTVLVGAQYEDALDINSGALYAFTRSADIWSEQQKLTAIDGAWQDQLGGSVALSGDTAIVGASGNDAQGTDSGAAYVFLRTAGVWAQDQKLLASDGSANALFGTSVALQLDRALISGYIFARADGSFSEQQKLAPADGPSAGFGKMGALDADTALVTASTDDDLGSSSGSAYVFVNTDGVWTEQQKILASDGAATHRFGNGAALEGDTVFIGAVGHDLKGDNTGATYVFSRSAGLWTEEQKLFAGESGAFDHYGNSVAIDGDTAVGGAYLSDDKGFNTGAAYVFVRNSGVWSREQVLYASDPQAIDTFGTAVAVSGDTVMIGAMLTDDNGIDSGAVYVFTRSGGIWTAQQKLLASDGAAGDGFGADLALEGNTALIGAPTDDGSGSAYVFVFNGNSWIEQQKLVGSTVTADDYFGQSVSLSDDTAVVGAYLDGPGAAGAGAVYIFTRSNGVWTEQQKLTASDGADLARFGEAVSVDGDRILVGAYSDDEAANNAGAAYVFERSAGVWTERQKLFGDALSNHRFGDGVAIAGKRALVGATYGLQGAYVFVESDGLWERNEKLVPSDALSGSEFGSDVALSGDTAFIGAPADAGNANGAGASYAFVVTTLPNGAGCAADLECQSGHCVDSVCCDTVCGNGEQADCLACSIASGASEDGACSPVGDNSDCSDGNACTQGDRCQSGVCEGGGPVVCDDGEVCTTDSCNPADGSCTFDPVQLEGTSCDDGDACTQTGTCQSGICVGGDPVVCDDGEACTTDDCNPADGSCTFDPIPLEGADCEDGNACSQADTCQSGICVGGDPVVCDDGEACTADTCNPTEGNCIFDPAPLEGGSCEDGDACTQTDRCQSGVCVAGEPVVCDEPAECRGPGTCDPLGGECDYPVLMNGSPCSVGTCQDGVCEESSNKDAGGCDCSAAPLDGSAATLHFLLVLFALATRRRTRSRG